MDLIVETNPLHKEDVDQDIHLVLQPAEMVYDAVSYCFIDLGLV